MKLILTSPKATGINCLSSTIYGFSDSIWTTLRKPQKHRSSSLRTRKTVLHRTFGDFHTLALQGERRVYSSLGHFIDGRTLDTDKIGRSDAGPHAEGGAITT